MRILLELEPYKEYDYSYPYYYHIQGMIYNAIKDSKLSYIHNKDSYKFFCFSNLFPLNSNIKKLIISSPHKEFIDYLYEVFENRKILKIGSMNFKVSRIKKFKVRVKKRVKLVTATPIIIRIPRDKYEEYGIKPKHDYDYLYWRKEYPLNLFIEQLRDNAIKKYKEFKKRDIDNSFNIKYLNFKKQVSIRLKIHDSEHIVIGTLWEFFIDNTPLDLLRFIIDTGLGERNSLGFGFVNIV
ncbi:MAG: CRISPR-associated protein Cas6 [Candidatus Nitrosocaldaceae archaeon]|nr:MAG: CRISPR-associated protein Cas6 [Candidatus Nitrosocaldaceae archaeon]GIU72757.1 MAG: CRISPR-associated protein Cas6 [Candidatus Nitrosocaldaceae archaeon]